MLVVRSRHHCQAQSSHLRSRSTSNYASSCSSCPNLAGAIRALTMLARACLPRHPASDRRVDTKLRRALQLDFCSARAFRFLPLVSLVRLLEVICASLSSDLRWRAHKLRCVSRSVLLAHASTPPMTGVALHLQVISGGNFRQQAPTIVPGSACHAAAWYARRPYRRTLGGVGVPVVVLSDDTRGLRWSRNYRRNRPR